MELKPLSISGAFSVFNSKHEDFRGEFVEWFRSDKIELATGLKFQTIQANLSVSAAGSLRGIHYADVPPGQAKYVTCVTGSIMDYVVDIRVGSPTFGEWVSIPLNSQDRNAVLIDVALGHAFLALEPETTVAYLVTDHFKPDSEHAINPLDADVALAFPMDTSSLLLSPKDEQAPNLSESLRAGHLPRWKAGAS